MFPLGTPVGSQERREKRLEEEVGGSTLQRFRMPEEDGCAFDVHHPYLQMRNLMHRREVMAWRLLSTLEM